MLDLSAVESVDLSAADVSLFADLLSEAAGLASEDAFDLVALAPLLFSLTWSLPLVVDFRHGGYTISAPIVLQKNSGRVQTLTRGLRLRMRSSLAKAAETGDSGSVYTLIPSITTQVFTFTGRIAARAGAP